MESFKISSHVNSFKTEYINLNHNRTIQTVSGTPHNSVQEFTYRRIKIFSNESDIIKSTGKIWDTDDKFCLLRSKRSLFHATLTSFLLYRFSVYLFYLEMERRLYGAYTYIQKFDMNVSWRDRLTTSGI